MKCTECKYAVLEDNGYSNYTVEGTGFSCAKKLHPSGSFDMYYGEVIELSHADNCLGFEKGEPVSIDVDGEAIDELSPEQRVIWMMHTGPV